MLVVVGEALSPESSPRLPAGVKNPWASPFYLFLRQDGRQGDFMGHQETCNILGIFPETPFTGKRLILTLHGSSACFIGLGSIRGIFRAVGCYIENFKQRPQAWLWSACLACMVPSTAPLPPCCSWFPGSCPAPPATCPPLPPPQELEVVTHAFNPRTWWW